MIKRILFSLILFGSIYNAIAQTCLNDWKYRTDITVTNPNLTPFTNYQIKVIVNTQSLISSGKLKPNADDLRFTDAACNNLHYWIDSNLNTTTTVIWIKTRTMAGGGASKIFMYYGNYCAAAAQNGDSTFMFFDDFSGGTLNASKWNVYKTIAGNGTVTLASGRATIATTTGATDNIIRSIPVFPTTATLESKIISNSGEYPSIAQLNSGTFDGVSVFTGVSGASNVFNTYGVAASGSSYSTLSVFNNSPTARANGVWTVKWSATNAAQGLYPGGSQNITTTPAPAANAHAAIGIFNAGIGSVQTDWIRARQYAPLEPATSIGSEISQSIAVNFSPNTAICPGDSISVIISKNNIYLNNGNTFTIQLSDATGAFGAPTTITSYTDTVGRTLRVRIPIGLTGSNLYKIRVVASNPVFSCFVADSNLIINSGPTANYTFVNDNQCFKRNNYNFTSTSTTPTGTLDSFYWLWQDGGTDTIGPSNLATHKFRFYLTHFRPILKVLNSSGCIDTFSRIVNLRESPEVATEFNDTIQCFRGNFFKVNLTTTTLTGTITSKSWNPGDGSPNINGVDSFTKAYNATGFFTVRQFNTHSNGCIDTGILSLAVNEHPNAVIKTNDTSQCITGNRFIFESLSTIGNGLPLVNNWDLGNSFSVEMQDSVHRLYPTIGNRNVRLITYSDDGVDACYDTAYQFIEVNPIPKAIINKYDNELCYKYNNFRFKAQSTVATGTVTNNWDFGDMTTVNAQDSVAKNYASNTSQNYTVELKTISDKGCRDSVTTQVTVKPSSIPSFTINQNIQCYKYNLFKVKNTSTNYVTGLGKTWIMGDGNQYGNFDSIEHNYSNLGKYPITLIIQNSFNCKDTLVDTAYLLENPTSIFVVDNDNQCLRTNEFNFTDNSTFTNGVITGNKWLFDDGNTLLNIPNPAHIYNLENTYNVGLLVYGNNGCNDTSFLPVNVNPHAATDFFINDTGQCLDGNLFTFTPNTFITIGSSSNKWLYGDGASSLVQGNVSKKYSKDSTYIVTNVSISDQGCLDTIRKTVTVFPKPKTGFTINNINQCRLGNIFNYTATTTIKKGTFTNSWTLGDGNIANLVNNVQHTYANAQLYNVRLIAISNESCRDTTTRQVRTYAMPVANFISNYNKACLKGNDFSLQATTTVPGNAFMSHNWYFGDNDSAINTQFVNHSYLTDSNAFTITLISKTNIGNCRDTIEKQVKVFPMPIATFTIDDNEQCFLNHNFNFNSTSTIKNTDTLKTYAWLFGDNTSGSLPTISKTYNKADSFRVSLAVTTNNGCVDSIFKRVYINPMPVADFTVSPKEKCLKNNSFTFVNKSTINKGIISTHRWLFNSNDSIIIQTPLPYSYSASGTYTVELRTTTNKGCWDTATATVSVNPNPTLDFTVDPVCLLKDSSEFINLSTISTGSITSYRWLFGNGRASVAENPKHLYKNVGNYDIRLTAITDKGCRDTIIKLGAAIVNPNPISKFDFVKIRSFENEVDVQYIDSSKNAVSWLWNFSGQGSTTEQEPIIYYTDTVTQRTQLVVTNIYGCTDTSTRYLFIAPDVIYYMANAFSPNDDNINETFKPIGLAFAKSYKFIIFNRWGEILFKTDNPKVGWDGKFQGEYVMQGVYYYRLEFVGADDLRHEEENAISIIR